MSSPGNTIAGLPVVVLGAGRGRRMGGPKTLMTVDGRPWWTWQDDRLRAYSLVPCWVVSKMVYRAMCLSDAPPEPIAIADETLPMFASVLLGLATIDDLSRGLFLLPVDTPAPQLAHWVSIARAETPAHPTFQGKGGHPLYLPGAWLETNLGRLIRAARAADAEAIHEASKTMRLDRLIKANSRRVAVDDPAVILNMNEPADVRAWVESKDRW